METLGIGRTDIGKKREQNEAMLFVDNDLGLYMVSDGMGGHAAGETASRLAVDAVARSIRDARAKLNRVKQGLEDPKLAVLLVQEAIEDASRAVYDTAVSNPDLAGMGATLTLFLMLGRRAVMAHVGDTRLYLYRSGNVNKLSSDHAVAAELQKEGALTVEKAAMSQMRNVLTRALGSQKAVMVETLLLDVLPGGRDLLCSDGLFQYADEATLVQYMSNELEGIPEELIGFANASGGSDNTTVIVVSIEVADGEQAQVSAVAGDLQVKFAILQSVFLFENLSLVQLQRLLNICEVESVDAGSAIAIQGETCAKMIFVLDGKAELLHDDRVIGHLAAGDFIGETSLTSARVCRSTLRARDLTRLLIIRSDRFASLVQRKPWFGLNLMRRMAARSDEVVARLHERLPTVEQGETPTELEPTEFF